MTIVIRAACIVFLFLAPGEAARAMDSVGKLYGVDGTRVEDFDPDVNADPAVPEDAPLFAGIAASATRIAVIDSGVVRRHPWLAAVVTEERSFVKGGAKDALGHGTAVALRLLSGVAHASRLRGAAPFAPGAQSPVDIISLKVTHDGVLTLQPVLDAIAHAGKLGVGSVNLSLGFERDSLSESERQRLCGAIAAFPDILFVAAAGNTPDVPVYPASCALHNVFPVRATDSQSGPAQRGFSAEGTWRPVSASRRLGVLFAQAAARGDLGAAEAVLSDMRRVIGSSLATALAEAELLVRRHDQAGLKAHAAAIAPAFRDDARYRFFVGVAAFEVGDFAAALDEFSSARKELAEFGPLRFNLAQTLMALGRHAEALEELRALRAIAPDYPHLDAAMARAAQGKEGAQ